MRVLLLSGLLLVPACFAPSVSQGVPCDPDQPSCPSGQRCVRERGAFVCSTGAGDRPDAAVDGDTDNDLVPDDTDNCPAVSNSLQTNYDGDRFGDACDPCPPFADDAPPDIDGDGVGDACDPDPALAGDRIARFEAFAAIGDWQTTGAWTAGPTGASIDLAGGVDATLLRSISVSARTSVMAAFSISQMRSLPGTAGVSVVENGTQCALIRTPTGSEHTALLDTQDTVITSTSFDIDPDQPYVVTLTSPGVDRYRCRSGTAQVLGGMAAPPTQIGVRARGVRATVHWLLVVETP